MKAAKFMDEKKVIELGVKALHRELGPVEARRFIALSGNKHEDSVTKHRKWQADLNPDLFISEIMKEYKK